VQFSGKLDHRSRMSVDDLHELSKQLRMTVRKTVRTEGSMTALPSWRDRDAELLGADREWPRLARRAPPPPFHGAAANTWRAHASSAACRSAMNSWRWYTAATPWIAPLVWFSSLSQTCGGKPMPASAVTPERRKS
jgi:hypothetical protein